MELMVKWKKKMKILGGGYKEGEKSGEDDEMREDNEGEENLEKSGEQDEEGGKNEDDEGGNNGAGGSGEKESEGVEMRKIGVDKDTMTEDPHKIFDQYANIGEIFFKPSTSDPKIKLIQEKTTFEIVKNVKGLESKTSLTQMPPNPSLVESKNRGVKREKDENELPI